MKILADESVDIPVYEYLKQAGFSIEHVSFIESGSTDLQVLDLAYSQKLVLLTVDKDFGELAFRNMRPSNGIVLYRLSGLINPKSQTLFSGFLTRRERSFKQISQWSQKLKFGLGNLYFKL